MYVQGFEVNRKTVLIFYFLFHSSTCDLYVIENCTEKLNNMLQTYLEKMINPQSCHHHGDSI